MDGFLMADGFSSLLSSMFLFADLASIWATTQNVLQVAVALGFVIFVHELGHFLAAKACGVKCEKFYVGFDIPIQIGPLKLPSSLFKFRWGETVYGIGILPLGGYVKMLGQDDNPAGQARENERIKLSHGQLTLANADSVSASASATIASGGSATLDMTAAESARTQALRESSDAETCPPAEHIELDPRSFPAKPVWQRMIIISAGVIVNVIFGVIFAVVAYRMGVTYEPALVGDLSPGDPAWQAGMQPGDKIVRIGSEGEPDDRLRFLQDLVQNVVLNGTDRDLPLMVSRPGQSQPLEFALRPSVRMKPVTDMATIGIAPASIARLPSGQPVLDADDPVLKQLRSGDTIVAIDGEPLVMDSSAGTAFTHEFKRRIAARTSHPVTLTVLRKIEKVAASADGKTGGAVASADTDSQATETIDITVPPTPMWRLGVQMQLGPVVAVRKGSPAEQAGIAAGDRIVSFAGQSIDDPMTVEQRLLQLIGQQIPVVVNRAGGGEATLQITPQPPFTYHLANSEGALLALETLGVACGVDNVIAAVEAATPAAQVKLQPGDEIVGLKIIIATKKKSKDGKVEPGEPEEEEIDLAKLGPETPVWPYVHQTLQMFRSDSQVQLTVRGKDKNERIAILAPVASNRWFEPSRGLRMDKYEQIRVAETWGEATRLGLRETKEQFFNMRRVLVGLFSGRVSPKNLGGPIMIAVAAGSEASHGLPRLLIFLTLLSVNLAVLNFLPIPALDGGHMVFLAAEAIRGKPVNERLQIALTLIGIGCLLSLMVFVVCMDVGRFFL